jgi:peptidoglycan glycosyltransferase
VFARSCNIPFAQLSTLLGPEAMVEGTKAWGIGEEIPIDLPKPAASTFGNTDNLAQELPLLAIRGFGQSEVQMVPLHMAMVAGAVANGGQMMKPYAVQATYDQVGRTLSTTTPSVWKTPLSPANASLMTELMIGVAERGTASCCIALEGGIPVAAKTGTAQLGDPANPGLSHAWIIAFAPADNPRYAVSVVLTDVQSTADVAATGGRLAGPIAKGMLDFLLTGAGSQPLTPSTVPAPATPAPATSAPATSAPDGGT